MVQCQLYEQCENQTDHTTKYSSNRWTMSWSDWAIWVIPKVCNRQVTSARENSRTSFSNPAILLPFVSTSEPWGSQVMTSRVCLGSGRSWRTFSKLSDCRSPSSFCGDEHIVERSDYEKCWWDIFIGIKWLFFCATFLHEHIIQNLCLHVVIS